jgi:phosphate transport system permease protein
MTTAVVDSLPQVARKRHLRTLREAFIRWVLIVCVAVTVLTTIGIIVSLFTEGITFFFEPEVTVWDFFTSPHWKPTAKPVSPENFGILPLINGTLMIAVIASVIALPLGVGSAVFLSEYSPENVRKILKPVLELLAGVPTVVYGYFALTAITPLIRAIADFSNATFGTAIEVDFFNGMSAAIVVGIMIVPMVASLSEDAMRSVPRALREAGYALGATKYEVATKVVVPAALSGVIAGFILAFSRAIGETMAVAIAAGSTPKMTLDPFTSIQTMTGFIVQVALGDNPQGSLSSEALFVVGAALFLMTFGMNVVSNIVVSRFREEYD